VFCDRVENRLKGSPQEKLVQVTDVVVVSPLVLRELNASLCLVSSVYFCGVLGEPAGLSWWLQIVAHEPGNLLLHVVTSPTLQYS
jgi:hypothetical protein